MATSVTFQLHCAAVQVSCARVSYTLGNSAHQALCYLRAIQALSRALGEANRAARHMRGAIMRALNFARAALRAAARAVA